MFRTVDIINMFNLDSTENLRKQPIRHRQEVEHMEKLSGEEALHVPTGVSPLAYEFRADSDDDYYEDDFDDYGDEFEDDFDDVDDDDDEEDEEDDYDDHSTDEADGDFDDDIHKDDEHDGYEYDDGLDYDDFDE